MDIINNSHAIGVDTRNLVLKTRGTLHVKVGNQYYEIDFRNLVGKTDEDKIEETVEKKEEQTYILSIDTKDDIRGLEYPGDNKLIVGLDGSLFVTKNNSIIDVTPKSDSAIATSIVPEVIDFNTINVSGKISSDEGYLFDFANGNVIARTLTVEDEVTVPFNTIKTRCCKTYIEPQDDDSEWVERNYTNYDFVEIVNIPDVLVVKSGTMVKSSVNISIPVRIEESECELFEFEKNGLYMLYEQGNEVIITKLN